MTPIRAAIRTALAPLRLDDASMGPLVGPGRRLGSAVEAACGGHEAAGVMLVGVHGCEPPANHEPSVTLDLVVEPGNGRARLGMEAAAAFVLLERALGGTGREAQPGRFLTRLESTVWRAASRDLLNGLGEAVEGRVSFKEDPAPTPETVVPSIVFCWMLSVAARRASVWLTLDEPSAARLMAEPAADDPAREAAVAPLLDLPAALPVRVGSTRIRLDEIGTWAPGSLVLLDQAITTPWRARLGSRDLPGHPVSVSHSPHLLLCEPGERPGRGSEGMHL